MILTQLSDMSDDAVVRVLLRASLGAPVIVTAWESGELIQLNEGGARLLGAPGDALIGRSILEFHEDPAQRGALLERIEAEGGSAQMELAMRTADGRPVWLAVSAWRIDYDGRPALLGVGYDVTAHKERERQLAKTQERLARQTNDLTTGELRIKQRAAEAANRAKSLFLAHISHELRSPLNTILGFSELVRDLYFGIDQAGKYREYGGYIYQAGEHLLALINDILDLAKVEAGKLALQPKPFDLAELLRECARMVQPMADRARLKFGIVAPSAIILTADRLRAKQMIINLLSNAIKFTPGGGKVELSAHAQADGAIAITIADTGTGMTKHEIAVSLEPFGRTGAGETKDPTGTGLGLPIVRSLIEAHGGRLEIFSAPGCGTTARLIFPPNVEAR
jgi:PAS domain S-box-containing protein